MISSKRILNLINIKFAVIILCFLLAGCVFLTHRQQIQTLKQMESDRKAMESYIKRQEELFSKLKYDIENNRLKEGLSKKEVVARYGEPVLCREFCLYRHPEQYSDTEMIYLYFDVNSRLLKWQARK